MCLYFELNWLEKLQMIIFAGVLLRNVCDLKRFLLCLLLNWKLKKLYLNCEIIFEIQMPCRRSIFSIYSRIWVNSIMRIIKKKKKRIINYLVAVSFFYKKSTIQFIVLVSKNIAKWFDYFVNNCQCPLVNS